MNPVPDQERQTVANSSADPILAKSILLKAFNAMLLAQADAGEDVAMPRWVHDYLSTITFVAMLLIGVLVHIGLEYVPKEGLPPWELVLCSAGSMLADSLAVAGLLGGTVDWFLKEHLIRNVAAVILGYALPQEVKDQIRKVIQTSIVRRKYHVRYTLVPDPPGGNEVIVQIELFMQVFNYGVGSEKYGPKLALEIQDNPIEDATSCDVEDREGKPDHWSSERLKKHRDKTDDVITWALPPKKLPHQLPADTRPGCVVTWRYQCKMPIPYSDIQYFFWPTIGAEVTASCPPELEFMCEPDQSMAHAKGSNHWTYNRLYMPGQLIRVRWKKRITPSAPEVG